MKVVEVDRKVQGEGTRGTGVDEIRAALGRSLIGVGQTESWRRRTRDKWIRLFFQGVLLQNEGEIGSGREGRKWGQERAFFLSKVGEITAILYCPFC